MCVIACVIGRFFAPRTAIFKRRYSPKGQQKTRLYSGFGGEGGIWTLAPVTPAYSLSRGAPSAVLGYFSNWTVPHHSLVCRAASHLPPIKNGGESGIWTHGWGKPSPVFKTGALNQLDHLSIQIRFNSIAKPKVRCQAQIARLRHFRALGAGRCLSGTWPRISGRLV